MTDFTARKALAARNTIISLYALLAPESEDLTDYTAPLTVEGGEWAPEGDLCWRSTDAACLLMELREMQDARDAERVITWHKRDEDGRIVTPSDSEIDGYYYGAYPGPGEQHADMYGIWYEADA